MKTSIYLLLIITSLFLACSKPEHKPVDKIVRTGGNNKPFFEVNSWGYKIDKKGKTDSKSGSYTVTLIKYRPKYDHITTKPDFVNAKTETIERTRIDDYWSAYLLVTERVSDAKDVANKPHNKVNRSIMFFSLDSAMLTADIEALLSKEKLKG